jgi:hypothetical protein
MSCRRCMPDAAYGFFVFGACIHFIISEEIRLEQLPRVVEYGLATAQPPYGSRRRSRPERGKRGSRPRTCLGWDR